jgi:hypothetical protein
MPLTPARTLSIPCRYAVRFDGVDDYVLISDSPSLNPTSQVTIQAWVYPRNPSSSATQEFVAKGSSLTSQRQYYLRPQKNTGLLELAIIDNTGTAYSIFSPSALSACVWQFVGGVYDGAYLRADINGVEVASRSIGAKTLNVTSYALAIGRLGAVNAEYFYGDVAEVLIYSRALSLSERRWNYENPLNPIRDGLVLLLVADPINISGGGWLDLSGKNNNGTIFGARLDYLFKTPVRTLPAVRSMPVAR